MPTFKPPTYEQVFNPEPGATDRSGLMRYYHFPVGYSVIITNGQVTAYPGTTTPTQAEIDAADVGSGYGGKAVFIGGHVYEITASEANLLTNAGYGAHIT